MSDAEDTQRLYDANGYAHLRDVVPVEVAQSILSVVQAATSRPETMKRLLRQTGVSTKLVYELYGHDYLPITTFHWGLTSRMCLATGKRLVPTYGFFRVYQAGDICIVHTDRPPCEHSLSVPLAYSDDTIWDIEVGRTFYEFKDAQQTKCGPDFDGEAFTSLKLNAGDALLYKGTNHRHGRITPNPNRWSAHLFLHWVDLDGPFNVWAFDRKAPPPPTEFVFPANANA